MPTGTCNRCGVYRPWLHGHHIVPRSDGGSNDPENIENICANCHEDAHGSPFGQATWAARRRKAREAAFPKELLEQLYVVEGLTMREVAERLDVGKSTVAYWLDDYGISRRQAGRPSLKRPEREVLVDLYLREKRTLESIASTLGVSHETVAAWCRQYGIPMRTRADSLRLGAGLTDEDMEERKRIRVERAEQRKRYEIAEDELRRLYLDAGLSLHAIAEAKGVSVGFLSKRLKVCGIPARPTGRPKKAAVAPPS